MHRNQMKLQNTWIPRTSRGMTFFKIVFIFLVFFIQSSFAATKNNYAIFIDAGSSGSRLHVFEYAPKQKLATSVPKIKDLYSIETPNGLASFVDRPQDLIKNL